MIEAMYIYSQATDILKLSYSTFAKLGKCCYGNSHHGDHTNEQQ